MIKNIIIGVVVIAIGFGLFKFFDKDKPDAMEQQAYSETLSLSTEYISLRYQTENVLEKAESFETYENWKAKMDEVLKGWKDLEQKAGELEKIAGKIAEDKVGFEIISPAIAYDSQEVSRVINSGSIKNQISRLAKHFGVDAKRAQLILNETQDRVSSEAYTEEGDVFEECEQNSMRIKNGAKVTVYVGGVVLTGGASAVVASGALATTATVVVGADLVLEVTEDEARIALGDRNKVSEMVSGLRSVTEPAAAILSLTNIPGNLSKGIDKLSALSFGADQVRSVIQDEKVLGISIKTDDKGQVKAEIAGLTEEELPKWKEENKAIKSNESVEEIINNAKMAAEKIVSEKENETKNAEDKKEDINKITGSSWKGTLVSVSGGNMQKQSTDFEFVLKSDGTVGGNNFKKWKQEGSFIRMFGEDEADGYYEFNLSGNSLTLSRMVIGGEEIMPGQEYMGGTAPSGVLYKESGLDEEDSQSNKNAMSLAEYNEMDDKGLFTNISSVEKYLGEPSVKTADDNGRIVYVYYDLVKYDSGNLGSVKMAFYNKDDYRTYIERSGASWDSNKETWDESGGGIRATSEIRDADTYKQKYGD